MSVQIKQFELTDQSALLSFLSSAYPGEPLKSDSTFWKWHFLENPHVSLDKIPLWIVRTPELVVGQMATIPVRLKVGESEKPALWIIDFMLAPEYRGRGLGKGLMQMARETFCTTMLALGYNKDSEAVLRSHKWVSLGNINRYHLMLFPGNAAKEIARLGPVRQLANLVYAPLRPSLVKLSSSEDSALREVTRFDSSFDQLWLDASTQWPCVVERSSRFLEWQFMKQPGKKFEVLAYYEGNQLLGYVVLFFRKAVSADEPPYKAAISDLCYSAKTTGAVIDTLLKGALRLALEKQAGGLVIDVLDKRVEQRLRQLGFWRIKASPPFMAGTLDHQDIMYERSNWFLTRGDSDVSIFEEPNI
jgi:GNAT superfamily N-acetyltransferase